MHICDRHNRFVVAANQFKAPKVLPEVNPKLNSPQLKSKSPKQISISEKLENSTYMENQREYQRNLMKQKRHPPDVEVDYYEQMRNEKRRKQLEKILYQQEIEEEKNR